MTDIGAPVGSARLEKEAREQKVARQKAEKVIEARIGKPSFAKAFQVYYVGSCITARFQSGKCHGQICFSSNF